MSGDTEAPQRERKKRKWDQPGDVEVATSLSSMIVATSTPPLLPFMGVGALGMQMPGAFPLGPLLPRNNPLLSNPNVAQASQQAAALVDKLNQEFVNKGMNARHVAMQVKQQEEPAYKEIVINDAEPGIRYKLTKRHTQDEIQSKTGAVVITRGRYHSPKDPPMKGGEKPLYLHVSSSKHIKDVAQKQKAVDAAAALIEEMLLSAAPAEKVYVAMEPPPDFDVIGKLRGPENQYLQHIGAETGARVTLRGRGAGNANPSEEYEALYLHIQCANLRGLRAARGLAESLVETVRNDIRASYAASAYAAQPPPPPPPPVPQHHTPGPGPNPPPPYGPPHGDPYAASYYGGGAAQMTPGAPAAPYYAPSSQQAQSIGAPPQGHDPSVDSQQLPPPLSAQAQGQADGALAGHAPASTPSAPPSGAGASGYFAAAAEGAGAGARTEAGPVPYPPPPHGDAAPTYPGEAGGDQLNPSTGVYPPVPYSQHLPENQSSGPQQPYAPAGPAYGAQAYPHMPAPQHYATAPLPPPGYGSQGLPSSLYSSSTHNHPPPPPPPLQQQQYPHHPHQHVQQQQQQQAGTRQTYGYSATAGGAGAAAPYLQQAELEARLSGSPQPSYSAQPPGPAYATYGGLYAQLAPSAAASSDAPSQGPSEGQSDVSAGGGGAGAVATGVGVAGAGAGGPKLPQQQQQQQRGPQRRKFQEFVTPPPSSAARAQPQAAAATAVAVAAAAAGAGAGAGAVAAGGERERQLMPPPAFLARRATPPPPPKFSEFGSKPGGGFQEARRAGADAAVPPAEAQVAAAEAASKPAGLQLVDYGEEEDES